MLHNSITWFRKLMLLPTRKVHYITVTVSILFRVAEHDMRFAITHASFEIRRTTMRRHVAVCHHDLHFFMKLDLSFPEANHDTYARKCFETVWYEFGYIRCSNNSEAPHWWYENETIHTRQCQTTTKRKSVHKRPQTTNALICASCCTEY
jgi:hypothetical protein